MKSLIFLSVTYFSTCGAGTGLGEGCEGTDLAGVFFVVWVWGAFFDLAGVFFVVWVVETLSDFAGVFFVVFVLEAVFLLLSATLF